MNEGRVRFEGWGHCCGEKGMAGDAGAEVQQNFIVADRGKLHRPY